MTTTFLNVSGIDPIVARDGRPFGDGTGNRMRGLPWPLPSAVAGSARRACVLNQPAGEFDPATIANLLQIEVAGLFPVYDGKLYLPAPKDCVWDGTAIHRALPLENEKDGSGCDMPNGLRPVTLTPKQDAQDFKPEQLPAWWPIDRYEEWLTGKEENWGQDQVFQKSIFFAAAKTDTRDRLTIASELGAAEESKLFAVSDLIISHLPVFGSPKNHPPEKVDLSVRVGTSDLTRSIKLLHPLGGNRRMAHWANAATAPRGWSCPEEIQKQLGNTNTKRVCLVLVTPAIFKNGWLPGWLDSECKGTPPGSSVSLQLVGVVNERWKALARFALDPKNPGPRPLHRMVPAGSVYFFEVVDSGNAASLADRWLQSVCDDEQDRRDGFGLAIWGTW